MYNPYEHQVEFQTIIEIEVVDTSLDSLTPVFENGRLVDMDVEYTDEGDLRDFDRGIDNKAV